MSEAIYDIPVARIDGSSTTLSEHRGEVLLVVNVASKCGLTPQYEGLEKLYEKFRGKKFSILGFPSNDLLGQAPYSTDQIKTFRSTTCNVQFPFYTKIHVMRPHKSPPYPQRTPALPETEGRASMEAMLHGYKIETTAKPEVVWNFEKFLVSRQGKVVRRFAPDTAPDAPALVDAIEAELAKA